MWVCSMFLLNSDDLEARILGVEHENDMKGKRYKIVKDNRNKCPRNKRTEIVHLISQSYIY